MFRQNNQQFIVEADRFVDAMPKLIANFEIFWGIPAANIGALEVGIETFGKRLILTGIAYKTRIILNGMVGKRTCILNECIGQTYASQEGFRYVPLRSFKGSGANI